jgi:hypothetical protein
MGYAETKEMIKLLAEEFNEEKRYLFQASGEGGQYTQEQKDYAFELIEQYGIRATARILKMPRRTLQRWCRKNYVWVKRCPTWVYGWAKRRRKRRLFWQRRGYF